MLDRHPPPSSSTLQLNFRASTVGQNQIQSTFMPHPKQDVNNYIQTVFGCDCLY